MNKYRGVWIFSLSQIGYLPACFACRGIKSGYDRLYQKKDSWMNLRNEKLPQNFKSNFISRVDVCGIFSETDFDIMQQNLPGVLDITRDVA